LLGIWALDPGRLPVAESGIEFVREINFLRKKIERKSKKKKTRKTLKKDISSVRHNVETIPSV